MILADTSVWIDHLRKQDPNFQRLLEEGAVLCHPFVIGELATGSLGNRNELLEMLQDLEQAVVAEDDEVLRFIELHRLFALGIGYIDLHLLMSARLTVDTKLWTRDKHLTAVAKRLGNSYIQRF